jgi:hypothetical protein
MAKPKDTKNDELVVGKIYTITMKQNEYRIPPENLKFAKYVEYEDRFGSGYDTYFNSGARNGLVMKPSSEFTFTPTSLTGGRRKMNTRKNKKQSRRQKSRR